VNRFVTGFAHRLAHHALALLALATLASCSGAVSGPAVVVNTGPLAITPAAATLYTDLPTTFVVTGGTGSYLITSSDQAVVPIAGAFTGSVLTVVPGPVGADTPVTLTVRDTANTVVTAALVVKPRTVSNVVTITPSSSQSTACGTAICSGGDAEVKVALAIGGVPLRARTVRFDVVSGDIRIITSAAGSSESLSLSGTAVTDDTGTARIRIRVLPDATSQTALLQITDTSTGFTQRTSVTIAPSSNAPLNAQPGTIEFQGTDPGTCATGLEADVIVFGGRAPYNISQPGSFFVSPTVVSNSGGRFTVRANGQCATSSQIAVVDSNGATVSVTATNRISPVPPTTTTTPFGVSSNTATLSSCNDVANISLSGGSGSYIGASGNSSVRVVVNSNIGSISRASGASAPPTVKVSFSDGKTVKEVDVTLTGPAGTNAQGFCP
jgi:hypothetical protein